MVRGLLFSLAYFTAALLIVFSVSQIMVASSSQTATRTTKKASSNSDARLGRQIFESRCRSCHDQFGSPTAAGQRIGAPELRSVVPKLSDSQIRKQISDGGKFMPAFKASLKPKEIDALVKYVRSFGQNSTAQ